MSIMQFHGRVGGGNGIGRINEVTPVGG